jgi:hypothetical protein
VLMSDSEGSVFFSFLVVVHTWTCQFHFDFFLLLCHFVVVELSRTWTLSSHYQDNSDVEPLVSLKFKIKNRSRR